LPKPSPTPQDPRNESISKRQPFPFNFQLVILTIIRTLMYTGHRLVFPYLPVIARGLGVSLEMVALAITIRSALGLLSPLLGMLSDRKGRKTAIIIGLFLFSVSALLIAFLPTYIAFLIGLSLIWVAVIIFDPAVQAYVGDRVVYKKRARAIAFLELAWSGAFLIGIPVVGWLLARSKWNSPYLWLAGLGLMSTILVWRMLPARASKSRTPYSLKEGLKYVLSYPPAVGGLLISFLLVTANQVILIIYGAWLENIHEMSSKILGQVSSVIGAAGILGLAAVAVISDRFGKQKAMASGILVNICSAVLLAFSASYLPLTVLSLFLFFFSFEFSLVTGISLLTELRPRARATMMAINTAALSAGDSLGAFLGSRVFQANIIRNVSITILLDGLVLILLFFAIRRDSHQLD